MLPGDGSEAYWYVAKDPRREDLPSKDAVIYMIEVIEVWFGEVGVSRLVVIVDYILGSCENKSKDNVGDSDLEFMQRSR